jgi:hypothetical protein
MVKRIIGYVAVVAVIAIVIFTAMNAGGYKSMLPEDFLSAPAPAEPVIQIEPVQIDSVTEWDEVENVDSLTNALSAAIADVAAE